MSGHSSRRIGHDRSRHSVACGGNLSRYAARRESVRRSLKQDFGGDSAALNRLAASATTHCMTGCAIGEVLGLVIATAAAWGTGASILLAVILAFFFGYSLTMLPLLRGGMTFATTSGLALAADTASITVMEIVDNVIMVYIPGVC